MSEYIRDITSEHLGPMGSDNDARLTRAYLLAHGWKDTDCIRDVDTRDWEDAVLSAIHTAHPLGLIDGAADTEKTEGGSYDHE